MAIAADFDGFSQEGGDPTEAEIRLITASALGKVAACGDLDDERKMVSPALIAALATGSFQHADWPDWRPHPDGLHLSSATVFGKLDLGNRRVLASISFTNCKFPMGFAGDNMAVVGNFFVVRCEIDMQWTMLSATIAGQFQANGSSFRNPGQVALCGDGARAESWVMDDAIVFGVLDLGSLQLSGQFSASDAIITNPDGDAILAHHVNAGGWIMDGARVNGEFNISAATIAGQFSAERALFVNPQGTAVTAFYSTFSNGFLLRDGATVRGGIDLSGVVVDKILDLAGSRFEAGYNRALRLQGALVNGNVFLNDAVFIGHFDASRTTITGRLMLESCTLTAASVARQRGELGPPLPGAVVNAYDRDRQDALGHHALVLQEVRIEGRTIMPARCPEGIVDLSHARLSVLEDRSESWPRPLKARKGGAPERLHIAHNGENLDIQHLVLDGLEYAYFEHPDGKPSNDGKTSKDLARARIAWLAAQSADDLVDRFNPQPWRQAASVLRAMGYDRASQIISIERRVRERYARDTPLFQRFISWLLHLVADYGYNPWKTVSISVVAVLLWAAAYWGGMALCGDPNTRDGALQCADQPLYVAVEYQNLEAHLADSGGYPRFGPIAYSLDTFIPIFDLGTERFWRANVAAVASVPLGSRSLDLPIGHIMHVLFVIERFLGAILIAIAVTGFTGLLTREEN